MKIEANTARRWMSLAFCLLLVAGSEAFADTRDLRVEGKMPAEYVAAQTGKSYAVVIGINDYEKVRRLTYAVPDAQAIAQTLEQRGFQVSTLYDRQATQRAIRSELGTKLAKKVRPEDRVLIYYAGHGEEEKVTGGKEMGYLVPVDGEMEDLAGTGVSMGLIKELADALPAKQVLFLVDVCYGGIAGQQFRSLPKMTDDYLRIITRERGRQLITAGGADQQAMEAPEWGHSVFTYYLLEGLNKGHADLNSDGIIPASELYTYLNERVFSAASLKGHQQRPELWALAAEKGEFVFFTDRGIEVGTPSAAVRQDGGNSALDEERRRLQVDRQVLQKEREAMDQARRQAEEQSRLAAERAQVEAEHKRIETERQQLQVAKAPTYSAPPLSGQDLSGEWTMTDGQNKLGIVTVSQSADQLKIVMRSHKYRNNRNEHGSSVITVPNGSILFEGHREGDEFAGQFWVYSRDERCKNPKATSATIRVENSDGKQLLVVDNGYLNLWYSFGMIFDTCELSKMDANNPESTIYFFK